MMPMGSLIRRTMGVNGSTGKLDKLTILAETTRGQYKKRIEVLFNPETINLDKAADWNTETRRDSDTGTARFRSGDPIKLTMDLFFDTYEAGTDVRTRTDEIFHLTTIEEHGKLHRPPRCRLEWGKLNFSAFYHCTWILTQLNQSFTLFLRDGTPVRATLSCTFQQVRGSKEEAKLLKLESADVAKTRVVRRGDTLTSIAGEEYDDPALWRPIATANGIDHPRQIPPGTVLAIPELP